MSKTLKSEADSPAAAQDLTAALIDATNRQTDLIAALHANQPRKRQNPGDALLEMFRKQFTYPVYQNGIEAQARGLSDETLKQAATVAPGRYLNDIVEVVRTGRDKEQRIFLFYDNSSIDKKMMLKNYL